MGGLEPPIQRAKRHQKMDGVRTLALLTKPGHDKWC
jgi:hypothetical protein